MPSRRSWVGRDNGKIGVFSLVEDDLFLTTNPSPLDYVQRCVQAFIGNRVSRMFARSATDFIAYYLLLPFQRYLFRQDILFYPTEYHPIALCVFIGIIRAVSPYAGKIF